MSQFPWDSVQSFELWCREYAAAPTVENLNSLHLAASIMYAKLSTYVMDTNAGRMEDGTD
jgi:hypothetical protein